MIPMLNTEDCDQYQEDEVIDDTIQDDYTRTSRENDSQDTPAPKRKEDNGKLQYSSLAFHLIKPGHTRPTKNYRLRNKNEHQELLAFAKKKKMYVGYSDYIEGQPLGPMIIDFDSVDAIHGKCEEYPTTKQTLRTVSKIEYSEESPEESPEILATNKPEKTLEEIMQEINAKIDVISPQTPAPNVPEFDKRLFSDIEDPKEEGSSQKDGSKEEDYACPYCNTIMKSKAGKTLHIKSKHKRETGEETVNEKERETVVEMVNEKETERERETEKETGVETEEEKKTESYACPYCDTVMKSKSGYTLHMKAKHVEIK